MDTATAGIGFVDMTGRFTHANRSMAGLFGHTLEAFLGSEYVDHVHPAERETARRSMLALLANDVPMVELDRLYRRRDGSEFWGHLTCNRFHDARGKSLGLIGVITDMTARKRAEEKLRESESRLNTILSNVGAAIFIKDLQYRYTYANHKVCEIFGRAPEEIVGKSDDQFFSPASVEEIMRSDRPVIEQGETVMREEVALTSSDGTPRTYWTVKLPLRDSAGKVTGLCGISTDITESKLAADKLSEKNTMLQTLIHAIPDQVFFKDARGRYMLVNKAMERAVGLDQDAIVGMTDDELSPPDVAEKCKQSDGEAIRHRGPISSDESYSDRNGMTRYLDVVKAPIFDPQGNLQGLVVVSRDITARKQSEEKIRQGEEFIRSILDTVDEGFIVIGRDYRIQTANKAYCSQTGKCNDAVVGRHCYEVSHQRSRPCYEEGETCAVRQVFATGQPHAAFHRHGDEQGHVLYVETKGFPIKDASGNVISVIETVNNITEKHLLEEERLKTQKLEAIGVLAGGIAHDFNNLLQGVFGYIELARMTIDRRQESLDMLAEAEKALHVSVGLTKQLLTFSKGGKPVTKRIDLRPVVEKMVKFTLSGSRVDYRMSFEQGLRMVEADEGQIGQVIQNIVLNADQAMPAGGLVRITGRNVRSPREGLPASLPPGEYVEIVVQDNGQGIPGHLLQRIFDPYFTTKETGTGLGLATSYSIVRNHGGTILAASEPNAGAAFSLYLPAVEAREEIKTVPAASPATRKGRHLVMDDEEVVRRIAGEMIRALGHEVDVAENGEAAIRKYQEARNAGQPFDVVLLDLTVRGGMGGKEALELLRVIDPGIKAIVSSGYSGEPVVSDYQAHGFAACLAKPYRIEDLKCALGALLS